jgi:hypothetical protein
VRVQTVRAPIHVFTLPFSLPVSRLPPHASRDLGDIFLLLHLHTPCRSPTLLYTQRLEKKVAELEAALSEATKPTNDSHIHPSHSESSATGESSDLNKDARVSLNESISLFQLPGSIRTLALANDQADQIAAGKESLVNSAWRERAFERLADIPVRH